MTLPRINGKEDWEGQWREQWRVMHPPTRPPPPQPPNTRMEACGREPQREYYRADASATTRTYALG